jgi:hypothetical protein
MVFNAQSRLGRCGARRDAASQSDCALPKRAQAAHRRAAQVEARALALRRAAAWRSAQVD